MDSYQAVYDAVRSRISNGDVGAAVENAVREQNWSFYLEGARNSIEESATAVRNELVRPSVLFRPALSMDGNQHCALYGSNLQEGIAGFGDSAEEAMRDFDKNWARKSV